MAVGSKLEYANTRNKQAYIYNIILWHLPYQESQLEISLRENVGQVKKIWKKKI